MRKIWYHGSNVKIEVFNPYSFDLGNSFQKSGWGTFCFKDYNYTLNFTIMRTIQNYYDSIENDENKEFLHKHRCTWDFVNERCFTSQEGLDFIIKNMVGTKIYIHYIDSNKLKIKGIGNDITHNEFTFRDEDIKPDKIEEITLSAEMLKNTLMLVNDVNLYREELVRVSKCYNRGLLALFIIYDYTINRNEIEHIIVAIKNGNLKVGDDLALFIKNNHIDIKKIPFITRFNKAIKGTINRKFFKQKYIDKLDRYNKELKLY